MPDIQAETKRGLPLKPVLIAAFVLLIALPSLIVSWLSYRTGAGVVQQLSEQKDRLLYQPLDLLTPTA